jgi:hypothetical protein
MLYWWIVGEASANGCAVGADVDCDHIGSRNDTRNLRYRLPNMSVLLAILPGIIRRWETLWGDKLLT